MNKQGFDDRIVLDTVVSSSQGRSTALTGESNRQNSGDGFGRAASTSAPQRKTSVDRQDGAPASRVDWTSLGDPRRWRREQRPATWGLWDSRRPSDPHRRTLPPRSVDRSQGNDGGDARRGPLRPVTILLTALLMVCGLIPGTPARAAGLLEPGCTPGEVDGPASHTSTCGGPVAGPSGTYLFSGEAFHTAVDMRIRGRGMDFIWARTYRSRVSPNIGMGIGWTHSYAIRLAEVTGGPSEARRVRFPDADTVEWDPPALPAGDPSALRYCTLRSDDPSDFTSATTVVLDAEGADTMTTDTAVPASGALFSYLVLPKNGTRAGNLGTDSDGVERAGKSCGLTGPEYVLHDGSGRFDTYLLQPGDVWAAPEFFRELSKGPNRELTLTFPDTSTWEFLPIDGSPAAGRIAAMVDRNGNTIEFRYDALGRLQTIVDTLGREIVVGYDANGFIGTLTDFTGREVVYEYYEAGDPDGSFDDLRSVTSPAVIGTPNGNDFPDGKPTVYTYSTGFADPNLNHNLLTITDPKGQTFLHNVYAPTTNPADLAYDRVVEQHWGGPTDVISYAYVPQNPTPGNGFAALLTVENDRVGNVAEYYFDGRNRSVALREYTGRAPDPTSPTTDLTNRPVNPLRPSDPSFFETRWTYNPDALAEETRLPNGGVITRSFDELNPSRRSQGNVLSVCRDAGPLGGDQPEICETFEYDDGAAGTNFVTRQVDGRGNETRHVYDAVGNLMRTTHRLPSVIEEFDYNGFGQMIERTWPDNDGHRRRDVFTYYTGGPQNGYRESVVIDDGGFELTTTYTYDARGNVIGTVDPKGNASQLIYNTLDQVVRRIGREVALGVPRYETDLFYDFNDNVVRVDTLNVDESGVVSANPHWTTIHEYDLLDEPVRACREVQPYSGPIPGTPDLPGCDGLPAGTFIVEEYAYDGNRNRVRLERGEAVNGNDPDNVVEVEYDERDLRFRDIRAPGAPEQSTTEYAYDAMGNITQVHRGTDSGTPDELVFRYDGYDRLVATEDPMGNRETFEYDANSNVVAESREGELVDDPGSTNNVRMFEAATLYDPLDRIEVRTTEHFESDTQNPVLDGQATTELFWSDSSHLLRSVDDRGNATTFEYDSANRRSVVVDARGNSVEFEYDANSNVIRKTSVELSDGGASPETFGTDFTYDGLDRLTSQTDNAGNTRRTLYDSRDNRILDVDAKSGGAAPGGPGNRTRMHYDGVNRLVSTVRILTNDGTGSGTPIDQIVTQQEWDDSHRLTARIDDNGNTTSYTYDARGNRVQTTHADGTFRTVVYDLDGDPIQVIDPNGSQTTIVRDANRRVVSRSIVPGPGIQGTTFEAFAHDGLNRVVRAEDDDSVVETRYDSLGWIIEDTQNGQSVRSLYDGVGNKLATSYPGGRVIERTYDALNRLDQVIEAMGTLAGYDWIGPGRIESRRFANGTQTRYEYDGIGNAPGDFGVKRMVRSLHNGPGGAIDDRRYQWDPMYNKTLSHDVTPGGSQIGTSYTYDSRYRLVSSDRFDAAGPLGTTQYDLDGVTNRLAVAGGPDPGAYVLDPTQPAPADLQMNQYTETSFDARIYDENGNLIVIDASTANQRDVVYDYRDQMVQYFDLSTGTQVEYRYDAYGRRIGRSVGSVGGGATGTRYFYDGWQVCEEQDGSGATEATYVYGVDVDEVLTMRRGGNDFFYHGDDQQSVVALTDATGNVVERYRYEDYGEPTFLDPTGSPIPGSFAGNPYLFTGRRFDPETGWYYMRTRYLDPRAGRFTTRDTLGIWGDGSAMGNGYTYAAGNPATYRDPFGEMIFVCIPGMGDDSVTTESYENGKWFVADSFSFGVEREMKESGMGYGQWYFADSFSFGVEREMKESGEKGGTQDMNIGVGELQECTISKSMDMASMQLAQFAINGNSLGQAVIDFVEVAGTGSHEAKPICYLRYKLDRCFVKSWSISGDADDRPTEEVAFYYNKIAFAYAKTSDGREFSGEPMMKWNNVKNTKWSSEMKWNNVKNEPWASAATPMGWDNVTHKPWSSPSGERPTEEVAYYFNKIGFSYGARPLLSESRYSCGTGLPAAPADTFRYAVEREMK